MDFLAWVAESVADWFSSWFKKDARILFLGLDNAGKVRQQVGGRGDETGGGLVVSTQQGHGNQTECLNPPRLAHAIDST